MSGTSDNSSLTAAICSRELNKYRGMSTSIDDPLVDPDTGKKIDFYKILGLETWPGDGEAKKAYYKAAMKLHPDKNRDNLERAEIVFKYLQEAWKTLSDPTERAYYDRNRDLILSGGLEADEFYGVDTFVNLASYRSSSCYDQFDDSPRGFYTVYTSLFKTLAEEEVRAAKRRIDIKSYTDNELPMLQRRSAEESYPQFGPSDASDSAVSSFYSFWSHFQSVKEFMHENYYSTEGNSKYRRLAEGENKKFREKARLQFSTRIRDMATYLKRRDPRVEAYQERQRRQSAEAQQKREEKIQQNQKERAANKQALKEKISKRISDLTEKVNDGTISAQEMLELENIVSTQPLQSDKIADEFAERKEQSASGGSSNRSHHNPGTLSKELVAQGLAFDRSTGKLFCRVCNQRFQMEGEFKSHLTSKKHRNAQKESATTDASIKATTAFENTEKVEKVEKTEPKKRRRATREGGAGENGEKDEPHSREGDSKSSHQCKICKQRFESRTKLFKHIADTGHAALKQ